MNGKIDTSLYFHIPFCTRKCNYCHFYVLPDQERFKEQLAQSLALEWDLWLPQLQNSQLKSIYFGGGTPSLFGPKRIKEVLDRISLSFPLTNLEITLEANPENISLALMQEYREAGINRVSIGVQTLNDSLLQSLSRSHTAEKALESVQITKEAGLTNISVDLMYDLPNQTLNDWENTLNRVHDLPIAHISLYNLTIEPHTVFFKYRKDIEPLLPQEEVSRDMYLMAIALLSKSGFDQYELSAFAKENFFSRHNVGYWIGRPFLGFGPSAFSYWEGKRFRNIANLNRYSQSLQEGLSPIDFEEKLDPGASVRELFVIQLRMLSGCNLDDFSLNSETLENLDKLIERGLLVRKGANVKLTAEGMLFYDTIASELV